MKSNALIYQWHFDPAILLAIIGLFSFYIFANDFNSRKKFVCCFVSFALIVMTSFSPLHFLGMHYYFSAHMISHVVLLLICGPLLVFSIHLKNTLPILSKSLRAFSAFLFKHSWFAWLSGVGIMWFWHIPSVFDFVSTRHQPVSIFPALHLCSMLIGGIMFSWPLFGPYKDLHIHPLVGIMYLFTACISCSLLGLLITFAPLNTFHHYADLNNSMNMAASNPLNISQAADQQAAGLIMWVPCCFVYLAGCIFLLRSWFTEGAVEPRLSNTGVLN